MIESVTIYAHMIEHILESEILLLPVFNLIHMRSFHNLYLFRKVFLQPQPNLRQLPLMFLIYNINLPIHLIPILSRLNNLILQLRRPLLHLIRQLIYLQLPSIKNILQLPYLLLVYVTWRRLLTLYSLELLLKLRLHLW